MLSERQKGLVPEAGYRIYHVITIGSPLIYYIFAHDILCVAIWLTFMSLGVITVDMMELDAITITITITITFKETSTLT